MNRLSRSSASSFRPPAKMGSGGGNMIEMVFALLVFAEIWKRFTKNKFKFQLVNEIRLTNPKEHFEQCDIFEEESTIAIVW
jgi:hypothetical protein